MVPYLARRAVRPEGRFVFFGTAGEQKAAAAIEAVQDEDLADVIGEEALAAERSRVVRTRPGEPST